MVKEPFLIGDHSAGLINHMLNVLTTAYKIGGYLLTSMLIGTTLMTLSMMVDSGISRNAATGTGMVLLVLPLVVILILYLKPLRDLKKQLDEKAAFLKATEEGVVGMAQTVRSFSDAIISNHKNTANALRAVRPHINSFPAVANWVDSSEDLSRDLIQRSVDLRDAATSIENAFRHGDTEALRQSIRKSQQIANQLSITASPMKLFEQINSEVAQELNGLKDSEALSVMKVAMGLAATYLKEARDPEKKDTAGNLVTLASIALEALDVSDAASGKKSSTPLR